MRIGVTGHRTLADVPGVMGAVSRCLSAVQAWFPASDVTPVAFSAVSALAEGADRLVAEAVFDQLRDADAQLEVLLPLPEDAYKQDFGSAASVSEFEALLARASSVACVGRAASRAEAYELAGKRIVDASDVMIAVWDGRPAQGRGGTSEIVDYARRRRVPVLVVPADAPASVEVPRKRPAALDGLACGLARVDELNRVSFDKPKLRRRIEAEQANFAEITADSAIHWSCAGVSKWAFPHLVRADYLALRYQTLYTALGMAVFAASALAVTAVAAQVVFKPEKPLWGIAEVSFLLLILLAFLVGRRLAVHERWLEYRSLAEAIRAAPFIALAGSAHRQPRQDEAAWASARDDWPQRVFSSLWQTRPVIEHRRADARELGRVLAEGWVDQQVGYHRDRVARSLWRHAQMTRAIVTLFACTLVIAVAHVADVTHEDPWPKVFTFLAIALPGFGAALTGVREHRQYRLHAERSSRTVERLKPIRRALATGTNLGAIRAQALEAHAVMSQENIDWSSLIEFQDVEIIL